MPVGWMPERMRLRFSICSAMVNTSFPSFNKENCPRTEKRVRLCARAGKFFLWCHLACRKLRPLTGMQITSPPDNGGCRQRILGVRAVPRALCEPLCRPAFRPVLSCPGSLCVRRRSYFRITGLQHVLYHAGKQFARWNCAKEADPKFFI